MKINLDSPILHALSTIFDVVLTTVYFIIGCIPVVTVGASFTAMQSVMMNIAADTCSGVTESYWSAFKENFKVGTLVWLALAVVGAVVWTDIGVCFILQHEPSDILSIMQGVTVFCTALYLSMLVYAFAGLARYVVTFRQVFRNALIWTVKKAHWTLVLLVLWAALIFSVYLAWIWAFPAVALLLYLQAMVLNQALGFAPPKKKDINPADEVIDYD